MASAPVDEGRRPRRDQRGSRSPAPPRRAPTGATRPDWRLQELPRWKSRIAGDPRAPDRARDAHPPCLADALVDPVRDIVGGFASREPRSPWAIVPNLGRG